MPSWQKVLRLPRAAHCWPCCDGPPRPRFGESGDRRGEQAEESGAPAAAVGSKDKDAPGVFAGLGQVDGATLLCGASGFSRARGPVVLSEDGRGFRLGADARSAEAWQAHRRSVTSSAASGAASAEGADVLVTGARDLAVKCWSVGPTPGAPALLGAREAAHELVVTAVAAEGDRLASGSRDGAVKVWDLEVTELARGHRARNLVTCLRFCSNALGSRLLAQGSEDLAVRLWDWAGAGMAHPVLELTGYTYFPTCMDTDREWQLLTGCKGFDGTGCGVWLWDLRRAQRPLCELYGHQHEVVGCVGWLAVEGRRLALSLAKDDTALIWDLDSARRVGRIEPGFSAPCTSLVASQDGTALLATSLAGELRRWTMQDIEQHATEPAIAASQATLMCKV
jgi:WD40 repeat protein